MKLFRLLANLHLFIIPSGKTCELLFHKDPIKVPVRGGSGGGGGGGGGLKGV